VIIPDEIDILGQCPSLLRGEEKYYEIDASFNNE